jgi:hypothetical protein
MMLVDDPHRPGPAPWTPGQSFAVSFLFGVGACGTVAGLNFARLGKRHFLLPALLLGWVLFLAEAWVVLLVFRTEWARLAALLANVGVGLGFMLAQDPLFEAWKASCSVPVKAGDRYRPGRTGQLLMVCLAGLAVEAGAVCLLWSVGGTG